MLFLNVISFFLSFFLSFFFNNPSFLSFFLFQIFFLFNSFHSFFKIYLENSDIFLQFPPFFKEYFFSVFLNKYHLFFFFSVFLPNFIFLFYFRLSLFFCIFVFFFMSLKLFVSFFLIFSFKYFFLFFFRNFSLLGRQSICLPVSNYSYFSSVLGYYFSNAAYSFSFGYSFFSHLKYTLWFIFFSSFLAMIFFIIIS